MILHGKLYLSATIYLMKFQKSDCFGLLLTKSKLSASHD